MRIISAICLAAAILFTLTLSTCKSASTIAPVASTQAANYDDAQSPPPGEGDKALQGKISARIKQLGADKYVDREAAQKALEEIGEPALEQLQDATKNEDPEIAASAAQLWEEMFPANATLLITDKKGKPLSGEKVVIIINRSHDIVFDRYSENEPGKPRRLIDVTLDADGRIALGARDPGAYTISIETADGRSRWLDLNLHSGTRTYRVVLYEGATIKGQIFDADNKPLQHHTITLGFDWNKAARGGGDGEFVFEHVPQGEGYIRVYCSTDGQKSEDFRFTAIDGETMEMTLHHAEKPEGKLKCRIVDPEGKPYGRNVQLTARVSHPAPGDSPWWGACCCYGKPDEEGVVVFTVSPGTYEVAIFATGCVPAVFKGMEIKDGATTELPDKIRLVRGATLRVRLKGLELPEGFQGGFVIVAPAGSALPPLDDIGWHHDFSTDLFYSANADSDGDAVIDGLAPGAYVVRAVAVAHGYGDETNIEVKPGDKEVSLEIDFGKRSLLALNVVDKDTGNRIGEVETRYDGPDNGHIKFTDLSGGFFGPDFDANGRLLIQGCRSGQEVLISARGYKTVRYGIPEIPAGKTIEAMVQMEAYGKGALRVRLLPGKGLTLDDVSRVIVSDMEAIQPPPGYHWDFPFGKTAESENGVFAVENVSSGACYVSVIGKDGSVRAFYRADVRKGEMTEATFILPDVGTVEGVLYDHEGNVLPSERIMLSPDRAKMLTICREWDRNAGTGAATDTDNEGRFRFSKIPAGKHILFINHNEGEPEMRFIEVKVGETTRAKIVLDKPFSVTFTLKMPEGKNPPKDAAFYLMRVANNSAGFIHGFDYYYSSYEKSPAVISGVYPGKYLVRLTSGNGQCAEVKEIEITPATHEIEVDVSFKLGKQKISGKIKNLHGPDRVPFFGECVIALNDVYKAEADINDDGSFEFTAMPPGKYRIIVLSIEQMCLNRDEYIPVKEVTVEEGRDLEGVTIP